MPPDLRVIAIILGALALPHGTAFADDAEPDSGGAAAPGKAAYTLFNPVPRDQLRDMDTDRPNITNTPHTVDAGHLQIETGIFDRTHFRDRSNGANTTTDALSLGEVNFRLGILENAEINAAIASDARVKTTDLATGQGERASGFGDTVIGGKLNLWGNDGSDALAATALALQPQIKLPTAQNGVGNGHIEAAIGVPFLVNLPADFHLGLQSVLLHERNLGNSGYVVGWENSASLDHVVFGQLDLYLEYAAHMTTESGTQPLETVDIGFTYPLGENLVIDSGAFFGVNRATPQTEWTAGISARF